MPADFGDSEVVWSVTAHGKTESAYGSLRVDYIVDGLMKMMDIGGLGVTDTERRNQPPTVAVEGGAQWTVAVGEPLELSAVASDDGIPEPKAAASLWPGLSTPIKDNSWGLRVAWLVYRGSGDRVTFEPEQFKTYPGLPRQFALDAGLGTAAAAGGRALSRYGDVRGAGRLRPARDGARRGFITTADVAVTVTAG